MNGRSSTPAVDAELKDYVDVIRRRRWLLLAIVVVAGALAYGYAARQPAVYAASAEVLVRPVNVDPSRTSIRPDQLINMPTEQRVMASQVVAQRVADRVDSPYTVRQLLRRTTVRTPLDTQILIVTVQDTDPVRAAALAQEFADAYLEIREEGVRVDLTRRLDEIQERQDTAEEELAAANEARGQAQPGTAAEAAAQGRVDLALTRIRDFQAEQASVAALTVNPGEVIGSAEVPRAPISQGTGTTVLIGVAMGLVLALAAVFVRDRLDQHMRDVAAVERHTGLQVLGMIPRDRLRRDDTATVLSDPEGLITDAFRRLRTSLMTIAGQMQLSSFVVTSAVPGEGKSSTAVNLAITLAQSGYSVLLVSADLRLPTIHLTLGLPNDRGLGDVLRQSCVWEDVVQDVPGVPGLQVITSGPPTENPGRLLHGPVMERMLREQQARKVIVVFDAPPVLAVSDALELSGLVGGVLVVTRGGSTKSAQVSDALAQLEGAGANVLGAVLSHVPPQNSEAFRHYTRAAPRTTAGTTTRLPPRTGVGSDVG